MLKVTTVEKHWYWHFISGEFCYFINVEDKIQRYNQNKHKKTYQKFNDNFLNLLVRRARAYIR